MGPRELDEISHSHHAQMAFARIVPSTLSNCRQRCGGLPRERNGLTVVAIVGLRFQMLREISTDRVFAAIPFELSGREVRRSKQGLDPRFSCGPARRV